MRSPVCTLLLPLLLVLGCSGPKNPEKAQKLEKKAVQQLMTPSTHKAINLLQEAIKYDSTNRSLYTNLVTAYSRKKEYGSALDIITLYQKRQDEKDLQLMTMKAINLYCMGKEQEAVSTLKTSLKKVKKRIRSNGMNEERFTNKMDALLYLGKKEKAKDLSEKYKEEYPHHRLYIEQQKGMKDFGNSIEKNLGRMCKSSSL